MTELADQAAPESEGAATSSGKTDYTDKGPGWVAGNITRDPELHFTPAGRPIVTLRVAISDRIKDRDTGQWKDGPTVYRDVNAWGGLAERAAEHLRKGDRIVACGRWQLQEWTAADSTRQQVLKLNARDLGPSMLFIPCQVCRPGGD